MVDRLETYRRTHLVCSMFSERRAYKHDPNCARPDADSYEEELRNEGAAVAFGIVGMAEAIGRNYCGYRRTRYVTVKAPPVVLPGEDEPCSWCSADAFVPCHDWCGANATRTSTEEK